MAGKLGTLLVREGAITPPQLEEALRVQVLYGGRLGTNLVELGFISADDMTDWLGRVTGFPVATQPLFDAAGPEALALIPVDVAERFECFPLRKDGRRLHLAMVSPADLAATDALSYKTGLRVVPYVAPEVRLYEALERRYGLQRRKRFIHLGTHESRAAIPGSLPPPPAERHVEPPPPAGPHPAPPLADVVAPPAHRANPFARALADEARTEPDLPAFVDPGPPPEPAHAGPPAAPSWESAAVLSPVAHSPEPLTFEEASQALELVQARDEIAEILLRFGTGVLDTTIVFLVRDGMAIGWRGRGSGIDSSIVELLMLPLNAPSMFQGVADTREPWAGPVSDTVLHKHLFRALRRELPAAAMVVPVVMRERVVNLVYGERHDGFAEAFVPQFVALGAQVAAAYERIVREQRRRLEHR